LDVFEFPQIKNYDGILYLDTDILIIKPLAPIFQLIREDKLYALKEINDIRKKIYWGSNLFGDELKNYKDKSGFNSGVLLFQNTETMKNLFNIVRIDMKNRSNVKPYYFDQPFLNYNAKKLNLWEGNSNNGNSLINYVHRNGYKIYNSSNNEKIQLNHTLIHFCGGVNAGIEKQESMKSFLTELKRIKTHKNR
jgi:lipopolysaccharide biosynthesis glycosyltransferase